MNYLLDTNVIGYFMRNACPQLTQRIFSHHPDELFLSAITIYELEYGAEKRGWGDQMRQKLAMAIAPFNILPFTTEDAVMAGKIRAFLERKGTPIGAYDVQIAAQGAVRGMTVVTHNLGEFSRVPSLLLEDWVV